MGPAISRRKSKYFWYAKETTNPCRKTAIYGTKLLHPDRAVFTFYSFGWVKCHRCKPRCPVVLHTGVVVAVGKSEETLLWKNEKYILFRRVYIIRTKRMYCVLCISVYSSIPIFFCTNIYSRLNYKLYKVTSTFIIIIITIVVYTVYKPSLYASTTCSIPQFMYYLIRIRRTIFFFFWFCTT